MEDLSGLDWSSTPSVTSQQANTQRQQPLRPAPSPLSSRGATPLSAQGSGHSTPRISNYPPSAVKSSASDSFSNLLSPQPTRTLASTSLQEKQKQLHAEKSQTRQRQDPYTADDGKFWEGLGSGRGTPVLADQTKTQTTGDDDILSAFSHSHPVDSSSHIPPQRARSSGPSSSTSVPPPKSTALTNGKSALSPKPHSLEDDDDPFGLSRAPTGSSSRAAPAVAEDDDILGDLAKPVNESARNAKVNLTETGAQFEPPRTQSSTAYDRAVAELLDMGFSVEQSKNALAETSTGVDVQEAVGVILNAAHRKSSAKPHSQSRPSAAKPEARPADRARRRSGGGPSQESTPAWMKSQPNQHHDDQKSEGTVDEKELSQYATEIKTSFIKSANTFWKASQKRVAKAVAELQPDADPSHPKWMRDGNSSEDTAVPRRNSSHKQRSPSASEPTKTTEADLLDTARPTAQPARTRRDSRPEQKPPTAAPARTQFQAADSGLPLHLTQRSKPAPRPSSARPLGRVNRQMIEDETAQAYVSPARRKKQPTKPASPSGSSLDIFSTEAQPTPATKSSVVSSSTKSTAAPTRQSVPPRPRPKEIVRESPAVSPAALSKSYNRRKEGTVAFKRGDYAVAHSHYSAALTPLPLTHPVTIVIRCNRALTALKTGEPRSAIEDADLALSTIGPSTGEGETIGLDDEGEKPMREFYGKALMRKAEAFEQMEKWNNAAQIWRQAVEGGHGGAVAIQGRNRCEEASGAANVHGTIAPVKKAAPARPPKPRATPSALADLNGTADGAAVKRLREKAAAEAAASDEAFSLTDAVEARLTQWKGAKADNLRALLASLDTVLWPDAGWKKVGMGDIVLPNKVKIVYMKAIAKVHPDKIPQKATTEQKMISASVFAILNEAWDKFKKDNGM